MTIDTERLKTDAAYWDEVAPKWATHYDTHIESFMVTGLPGSDNIPRPTKPAALEWNGEGYPPVGCECEWNCLGCNEWEIIRVIAKGKRWLIVEGADGSEEIADAKNCQFRPIRTAEQRQREELEELVLQAYKSDPKTAEEAIRRIAEAILSRYNLEPKK